MRKLPALVGPGRVVASLRGVGNVNVVEIRYALLVFGGTTSVSARCTMFVCVIEYHRQGLKSGSFGWYGVLLRDDHAQDLRGSSSGV